MILNGLNNTSLMRNLSLISLWFWNLFSDVLIQIIFFKDQGDSILPCSKFISPSKLVLKLSMVIHIFKMRTSNGNSKYLDRTY